MHSSKLTVPEHVGFKLKNGTVVTSLQQLKHALQTMSHEEYLEFAQPENHFANWIENVFRDSELANDIRSVVTKTETIAIIDVHCEAGINKRNRNFNNSIHSDVNHLHKHLHHLTKYDSAHLPKVTEPITGTIKDRLIDFAFGLIIGLVMGFILAQAAGLA